MSGGSQPVTRGRKLCGLDIFLIVLLVYEVLKLIYSLLYCEGEDLLMSAWIWICLGVLAICLLGSKGKASGGKDVGQPTRIDHLHFVPY